MQMQRATGENSGALGCGPPPPHLAAALGKIFDVVTGLVVRAGPRAQPTRQLNAGENAELVFHISCL